MSNPGFPGRPDHPDFWLLSQAVLDQDGQAGTGQPVQDILARRIDPDSAVYMAMQRALRIDPASQPRLATAWIDGLLAGMAFQHLKAAQDIEQWARGGKGGSGLSPSHRNVLRALDRLGAHEAITAAHAGRVAVVTRQNPETMKHLLNRLYGRELLGRVDGLPGVSGWAYWLTTAGLEAAREQA